MSEFVFLVSIEERLEEAQRKLVAHLEHDAKRNVVLTTRITTLEAQLVVRDAAIREAPCPHPMRLGPRAKVGSVHCKLDGPNDPPSCNCWTRDALGE